MLVTIGTPHTGHLIQQYVISLVKSIMQPPAGVTFEVLGLESCYVHSGRNIIFNSCQGDYLLFVDSDMSWEPNQIAQLIKAEKDIIGGLYYKRRPPYGPVVYSFDGMVHQPMQPKERLFRCDGVGTGFLLISRKVITAMNQPECLLDWGYAFDPVKTQNPGNAGSYFVGEDLSFCMKARHLGFEIWCDPENLVTHVGSQEIRGPL